MTTQNLETWKRLGQLLVKRGDITGEQLIRAIQSQRSVGGRIGTCLLEMEVVSEDRLLDALSEQLGVPAVRIDELRGISEELLRLVPSRVALRCQAVPFAASNTEVSIATLNIRDLALLDELAFCTNRRVLPHIANEVRIFEALEKHYGLECPRRYGHLLDRLNRSRYLWDDSARLLLTGSERPPSGSPYLPGWEWATPFDETRLIRAAASRSSLGRRPRGDQRPRPRTADFTAPARELVAPASPGVTVSRGLSPESPSLADVDRLLSGSKDRDEVGEIMLRFFAAPFQRSALFQVRRREIRGWLGRGDSLDRTHFRQLRLPLDQPSVFFNLDRGAEVYRGPLPPMPVHLEMLRPWGGAMPRECLVLPLRIRQRLVCVLYGDRGAADLADLDIGPYLDLVRKAAAALERCILRRKAEVA